MKAVTPSRKAGTVHSILIAMLILAVIFTAGVVGTRIYRALSPAGRLEVPAVIAPEHLDIRGVPDNVEIPEAVKVQVNVLDPSIGQLVLVVTTDLLPMALAIASLLLLQALAGSFRDGEPFGVRNVSRLRKLGFVLLAYPAVELVNSLLLGGILDSAELPQSVGRAATLHLSGALAGLGVLVLAEVFSQGVSLREDVEGTV